MKRKLINTIKIEKANLEYIAKNGKINGTLLKEIERIMDEYKALNIPVVIKSCETCSKFKECRIIASCKEMGLTHCRYFEHIS